MDRVFFSLPHQEGVEKEKDDVVKDKIPKIEAMKRDPKKGLLNGVSVSIEINKDILMHGIYFGNILLLFNIISYYLIFFCAWNGK